VARDYPCPEYLTAVETGTANATDGGTATHKAEGLPDGTVGYLDVTYRDPSNPDTPKRWQKPEP
jgi:hypothetical protein